jgi:hypothetical protein
MARVMGLADHATAVHGVKSFVKTRDHEPLRSLCRHEALAGFLGAADRAVYVRARFGRHAPLAAARELADAA